MLEIKHLSYQVEGESGEELGILNDVSLTVADHQFVVITGPNGGGKTTLAKAIMGLVQPTSGQILWNGEDVTGRIRDEKVGNTASVTSTYGCVREKLVALQRQLASRADVIMDGRDIGTCVLPEAQVKVYLTASAEVRAKRRYQELEKKGEACRLEEIEQDIRERDERDMHRKISPLRQAEDAILVDSSDMTIDQVVERIVALCEEER